MYGLTFDLECPYFVCFRKPTSTSVISSYPVPPYTTIRGVLANSLGLQRNDFSLQDKLGIGIRPLRRERANRELCKMLKLKEFPKARITSYPSSPMFKDFLVEPAYRIYLGGEKTLLEKIKKALEDPARPLYLGQSDDVVDILASSVIEINKGKSKEVYSLFPGIETGCELLKIPYKFQGEDTLIYSPILSLPPRFPWRLERETELYLFNSEAVWLLGEEEFNALSKEG